MGRQLLGVDTDLCYAPAPTALAVGAHRDLWIAEFEGAPSRQVGATLQYRSDYVDMWVQDGWEVERADLEAAAATIEGTLVPTLVEALVPASLRATVVPQRLSIVHADISGAVGYVSAADAYSRQVLAHSNEMPAIYVSLYQREPGTEGYLRTIAHEFQHLVHQRIDPDEDAWVEEGFSRLAEELAGFEPADVGAFLSAPDTQLNAWATGSEDVHSHYAASYLWFAYLRDRLGPDAIRSIVGSDEAGARGHARALEEASGLGFEELFSDWVIANYAGSAGLSLGPQAYQHRIAVQLHLEGTDRLPYSVQETVHQFGTDYVEFEIPSGDSVRVAFSGSTETSYVPADTSGDADRFWWSGRCDECSATLTRSFDLTNASAPVLTFRSWYEIEQGWDYAYIEVSVDDGKTWDVVPTNDTVEADPHGESFGPALTGQSLGWVQETASLAAFEGQHVQIRFQVLTDDAVNYPGLCVDDIAIPEIGYRYDANGGDDSWTAQGFIRTDNVVPQRFLVEAIVSGEETTVIRPTLDAQNQAELILRAPSDRAIRAVLAISGATHGTTEVAPYSLLIESAE